MKVSSLYIWFILLCLSCTFEGKEGNQFYDLMYVERGSASMPLHIHGNIDSDVIILILHGGPGGNGLEYRPGVFAETIENEYAVAYFDQRGQGMSQGHLSADESTLDELVEDVRAAIAVIKFKYGQDVSLFLFGHSWGGTLGTAYMVTKDYQEEVNGWIEVDGAHDFDLLLKAQVKMIDSLGSIEIQNDRSTEFWNDFMEAASKVDTNDVSIADISSLNSLSFEAEEKLIEAGLIRNGITDFLDLGLLAKTTLFSVNPLTNYYSGNSANSTILGENGIITTRIADDLGKISKPTLLLWGAYDLVVPPQLGRQALDSISTNDKELVILESSGHSPMNNQGGQFRDELIEFIERHK